MTTVDFDEILAEFGGAKQLAAIMADCDRRSRLLNSMMDDLLKAHPHAWVAMPESGDLIFAPSNEALLDQVRAAGQPTNTAVVRFLDPNPPAMIL